MTSAILEDAPASLRPSLTLVTDDPAPAEVTAPVRVTGRCQGCAGVYINDLAWRRADAEQLEAWTINAIGPHAGNGRCSGCVEGAKADCEASSAQVIEDFTVELSMHVAAHLADPEVPISRTQHPVDIAGELELDIWDVISANYGTPPGEWRSERACGEREDLIFTEKRSELAEAKKMCGPCPVRSQCLSYALHQPDSASAGVWGGMHQRNLRDTRDAAKREAYRRNGVRAGRFGKPVPLDD